MRILLLSFVLPAALTLSAQDRDQEIALGSRLAGDIRAQSRPVESPAALAYANSICRKLAAKLPDAGVPYTLELNAGGWSAGLSQEPLALPGGRIFVAADQILAAQSEAEFAGLLAHSMAHIAKNQFTPQSGEIVWPTAREDRGRFEFEADLLAIKAAGDAGYDPAGLLRYLNRLQRKPGTSSSYFAPPPVAERVAALESVIRALPAQTYQSPDPGEFVRIQQELRLAVALDSSNAPSIRRFPGSFSNSPDRPTLKRTVAQPPVKKD
jgi:predicted Zn-dependent protease